ncbi:N-acetylornithine aminotransferase [Rivularia sp. IAM M-261]|nr:N-acetylornithine aminotransferase [Rivularia sp. IAM M-261]
MKENQQLLENIEEIDHNPHKAAEFRHLVIQQHKCHVNKSLAKLADLMGTHIEVRSSGNYIFDERGEKYLACGGYGVFTIGHCHPTVIEAVKSQLERHPLSTRALLNAELAQAAETLASVTPKGLDYVYFANSGAEATEAGLKLARLSGKTKLVAMEGGYHGKTFGALSVTSRAAYRMPFQPLLPDVEFIPFADSESLEKVLLQNGDECCVILEPVQAEGGVIIPYEGYLREVERLCRHYGAFLILDEIQTGLARLGTWWGADREQIVPDVLLVGKALSGGVIPVSAAVASKSAYFKLNRDPLLHTSTFAGSPLATVAARTAINVIKNEGIVSRAKELGEKLIFQVKKIIEEICPHLVREVRGVGLLIGIEFEAEFLAGDFMFELMHRNVLVSYSLNAHRVVRLTPPATLDESDVSWLITAISLSAFALRERNPSLNIANL